MRFQIIFLYIFYILLKIIYCADFDSYELNRIEFTPLHDAIIFNDIAQIMNEFENNMNSQLNTHIFSNSESEEDIENLLSEYQHYLDKAHKQRQNYMDKSKVKNKIPPFRREKYTKLNPTRNDYDEKSSYYFDKLKRQEIGFLNPLETFMPPNSNILMAKSPKNVLLETNNAKKLLSLPPVLPKLISPESIESSCYCKDNQIPCRCACKQCILSFPPPLANFKKIGKNQNSNYMLDSNNLNIRIKIDVQMPNISAISDLYKHPNQNKSDEEEGAVVKTLSTINLPFPYFNFPIPLDLLAYKNHFNYEASPVHKITIQRKKKSRVNNNNKGHKSKKIITLHSVKVNPQAQINDTHKVFDDNETTNNNTSYNEDENMKSLGNISHNAKTDIYYNTNNSITQLPNKNATLSITLNHFNSSVNVFKNDNLTNELPKIENSIETDFEKNNNNTVTTPLRLKREINAKKEMLNARNNRNRTIHFTLSNEPGFNKTKEIKRLDKMSVIDTDLLYWPVEYNTNKSLVRSKNITALILERETKRAKLNFTHDTIQSNRTSVLEHSIFGDVDWNDVDSVVPVFISFVGKYLRGILTFCSQEKCHSIRCADKICFHRMCTPEYRYNNKGHCIGNNDTDSVAVMESLMDLPSNITFEVVNILQDKMLGKLYGKISLCINAKCCTFAASKKNFQKSKCTLKELDSTGHCLNTKNVKLV